MLKGNDRSSWSLCYEFIKRLAAFWIVARFPELQHFHQSFWFLTAVEVQTVALHILLLTTDRGPFLLQFLSVLSQDDVILR